METPEEEKSLGDNRKRSVCIVNYQKLQRFSFTIGWPALQNNAFSNSAMFTPKPLARYKPQRKSQNPDLLSFEDPLELASRPKPEDALADRPIRAAISDAIVRTHYRQFSLPSR